MGLQTFDMVKKLASSSDICELTAEELKKYQNLLLNMLRDFDRVCRRLGIGYTLGGGSCLGAIRHNGFIPWDDDLDLNMSRSDFEVLKREFSRNFKSCYTLHYAGDGTDYDLSFPKIRLKGTVVRGLDDVDSNDGGAYLDIFIIEDTPDNKVLRGIHGVMSLALGLICSCRRFAKYSVEYLSLAEKGTREYRIFSMKSAIGRILSFRSAGAWAKTWETWNSMVRSEQSRFITIPSGRRHYFGEQQLRVSYYPVSYKDFETMRVPVPADADAYLTSLYGSEYMTPPPLDQRERHVMREFNLGSYAINNQKIDGIYDGQ